MQRCIDYVFSALICAVFVFFSKCTMIKTVLTDKAWKVKKNNRNNSHEVFHKARFRNETNCLDTAVRCLKTETEKRMHINVLFVIYYLKT